MKIGQHKTVAIILARGGSVGIPHKNVVNFCGEPLIYWTINQLKMVDLIDSIWVSSDSQLVLGACEGMGCKLIERPSQLAKDDSTSESGWIHAMKIIEETEGKIGLVVAPQVTSPIRDSNDIRDSIIKFHRHEYDSMFSVTLAKDLCLWSRSGGSLHCDSYDPRNPVRRRQVSFGERYIENGSFYIFKPEVVINTGTRFGNKIGMSVPMKAFKSIEIDEPDDLEFAKVVMKAFLDGKLR
jgi:N-acylneuraminate cytidylyltransferase